MGCKEILADRFAAEGQKLGQNSGDAWLALKAQRFRESTGDARTLKFGRIDMESAEEEFKNNSADGENVAEGD